MIPGTPSRSTSHVIRDKNEIDPLKIIEALVSDVPSMSSSLLPSPSSFDRHQFSASTNYRWGKVNFVRAKQSSSAAASAPAHRSTSRSRSRSPPCDGAVDENDDKSETKRSSKSRSRSRSPDQENEDAPSRRQRANTTTATSFLHQIQKRNDPSKRLPPLSSYYKNALPASIILKNKNMMPTSSAKSDLEQEEQERLLSTARSTSAFRTMFFGTSDLNEQESMIAEMMTTGKLRRLQPPSALRNEQNEESRQYQHQQQSRSPPPGVVHPNHPRYRSRYYIEKEIPLKPPPNERSNQITKEVFHDRQAPFSPIRNEKQRKAMYVATVANEDAIDSRIQTASATITTLNSSSLSHTSSPMTATKTNRMMSNRIFDFDDFVNPVDAFMDEGEPRSATVRTTSRGTARYWPKPPAPPEPVFCEIVPPRTFIVTEASLKAAAQKARREELLRNSLSTNRARRFELPKSIEDAAKRAIWIVKQAERAEAQQKEQDEELHRRETEGERRKRERLRREKRMRAALGK